LSIEQRILDHVESERDEVISFMQRLIQTRSVTGEEAEIGALMEKECTRDGLEVDLVEPQPGRVSVVAKHTGTGGGPRMMMYSHYDVVRRGTPTPGSTRPSAPRYTTATSGAEAPRTTR
jgi:acetylornithine deacetylase/succinyl-diaminopimelate desuccinylase-like protein